MAFHQPTRQSLPRVVRPAAEEQDAPRPQTNTVQDRPLDESQTSWVLFAPATEATTASYMTETEQSLETPGRSRLSDLGSLHTLARSDRHASSRQSAVASAVDDESVEDDAELDSLDSHLPEFRSVPGMQPFSHHGSQHALPVLPGHDGLGSFRLDQPALGTDAQDQIYQFERFNPRRTRRRRESLDRVQLEVDPEQVQEAEKRQRVEAWRLEHSRILLDEVQRETRRRRKSQTSSHRPQVSSPERLVNREADSDHMTWHDEEAVTQQGEDEGFLARFTRKVMTDLLGIDEHLLSILLGQEAMPDEAELSTTPRASQMASQPHPPATDEPAWELHVLERVSRELGLLVNQLSHHPGAFSTYSRVQQAPLPYAGLPVIPETNTTPAEAPSIKHTSQASFLEFRPTMGRQASHPISIPGRESETSAGPAAREDVNMSKAFTKEEWEQDLDIKLVFKYLRSRFSSRFSSSTPPVGAIPSTAQETAAKVARVRQHHPLIARTRPAAERRTFKATTPSSPVAMRHQSSCASQSTRRSARRSSCSSRHYWDIGGSLGTGSMIASNGPMGSWGEV